jgi:hypothetical protein
VETVEARESNLGLPEYCENGGSFRGGTPRLRKPNKTLFADRCKELDWQEPNGHRARRRTLDNDAGSKVPLEVDQHSHPYLSTAGIVVFYIRFSIFPVTADTR